MLLRDGLRLFTAGATVVAAAFLWWELVRHHPRGSAPGRRSLIVYAAVVASLSATFRLMVAAYTWWPEPVQIVLRQGDIAAVLVVLVAAALALLARGLR